MNFVDYINASLDKGSIGAYISVGIFALIGVSAFFGAYYGAARGFSKSVIRLFTVVASAVCALLLVSVMSNFIVQSALEGAPEGAETVDALLEGYFPGLVDSLPVPAVVGSAINGSSLALHITSKPIRSPKSVVLA